MSHTRTLLEQEGLHNAIDLASVLKLYNMLQIHFSFFPFFIAVDKNFQWFHVLLKPDFFHGGPTHSILK